MSALVGPTSQSVISQRLRLRYVDWGNEGAPLLILQHGGKDHCRSWDWAAQELRKDWHVIAPDLRGHGDSAWSAEGHYPMETFVYDFAQVVQALGQDQVTIVAHSLGGNIASRYAALYPERVRKLVNIEGLGAAPSDDSQHNVAADLRRWIENKRQSAGRVPRRYPSLEAAYARMKDQNAFLSDDQARHLTVHGSIRNEDGTWSWKYDPYLNVWPPVDITYAEKAALWASIACPVLLLFGTDSFATSPAVDGRIQHFRQAKLIEYEQAGHWLHHDQLDRFLADLKAFL